MQWYQGVRVAYLHAPQLALVAQAELANSLQLSIQTLLLEGVPGLLEGLTVCGASKAMQRQSEAALHSR